MTDSPEAVLTRIRYRIQTLLRKEQSLTANDYATLGLRWSTLLFQFEFQT